jgi:ribosome-binding protein aMBF1 (putative translation factor)
MSPTPRFVRKRITGRPTPEEAAHYRQALKEVEADKDSIIARGKALLQKLKSAELTNVVQALRDARLKKGLAASEVAERLEMDAGNYSRLESGQTNPTLQTLSRMAEAIGVKVTVNVQDSRV